MADFGAHGAFAATRPPRADEPDRFGISPKSASHPTWTGHSPPSRVEKPARRGVGVARDRVQLGLIRPSSSTMSASPSPMAARMERPSGDQQTRRAMKVTRSPKSVIWRHSPLSADSAQIFVVKPSVSACASQRPSGESAGLTICQLAQTRMRARARSAAKTHLPEWPRGFRTRAGRRPAAVRPCSKGGFGAIHHIAGRFGPDRDDWSSPCRHLSHGIIGSLDEIQPASVRRPGCTEAAGHELPRVTAVRIDQPDAERQTGIPSRRDERNRFPIRRPDRDADGYRWIPLVGDWRRPPPSTDMAQRFACPPTSERNATSDPSGETVGVWTCAVWRVICRLRLTFSTRGSSRLGTSRCRMPCACARPPAVRCCAHPGELYDTS